ncbi:hypothetical protein SGLAM104S_03649 [Streptomyces glaucescens]
MPDPSGPGGTGEGGDTGYDDGPVPVVPDRCLGTWEGQGTALDGRLPVGTFRVTVRRTEVGEQLGPVRQTDALGGVCTDVLMLTKTIGQQLVAASAGAVPSPATVAEAGRRGAGAWRRPGRC